jgi:hypothetical protein
MVTTAAAAAVMLDKPLVYVVGFAAFPSWQIAVYIPGVQHYSHSVYGAGMLHAAQLCIVICGTSACRPGSALSDTACS